jgi:hypothetical protein
MRSRDDRGFALVTALVMAIIIAGLLLSLQILTRDMATQSVGLIDDAELRSDLAAGLNRAIYAYATRGDPMRTFLVADGRPVAWTFREKKLVLSVASESGKWDLNSGDRNEIAGLLTHLQGDPIIRARILGELDRARSERRRLVSVLEVLPPLQRMTTFRATFERHFTVATDQVGIDVMMAPLDTIDALAGLSDFDRQDLLQARSEGRPMPTTIAASSARIFAGEKPIYTFRAATAEGYRRAGALEALVSFGDQGEISIFSWTQTGVATSDVPTPHEGLTSAALSLP